MNIENETNQILNILNNLCILKFNNNYNIKNNENTYDLGNDSKILSKIYEIILISELKKLLEKEGYSYIENEIQNKYPDFIIISKIDNEKYYAIDIKSSFLKDKDKINGFTLGTYKGYFKDRESTKSIVKPYKYFLKHFCLCVIYKREKDKNSVQYLFVKEKWQIASQQQGSGNTCNIGSIKLVKLLLGKYNYFENEESFDKYWLSYKS